MFEEPWQGRALGMAVVAIAARRPRRDESPATAYYAAWLDALERLLAEHDAID